jgi:hypothetical protein
MEKLQIIVDEIQHLEAFLEEVEAMPRFLNPKSASGTSTL